jgi:hypothetical protein
MAVLTLVSVEGSPGVTAVSIPGSLGVGLVAGVCVGEREVG